MHVHVNHLIIALKYILHICVGFSSICLARRMVWDTDCVWHMERIEQINDF